MESFDLGQQEKVQNLIDDNQEYINSLDSKIDNLEESFDLVKGLKENVSIEGANTELSNKVETEFNDLQETFDRVKQLVEKFNDLKDKLAKSQENISRSGEEVRNEEKEEPSESSQKTAMEKAEKERSKEGKGSNGSIESGRGLNAFYSENSVAFGNGGSTGTAVSEGESGKKTDVKKEEKSKEKIDEESEKKEPVSLTEKIENEIKEINDEINPINIDKLKKEKASLNERLNRWLNGINDNISQRTLTEYVDLKEKLEKVKAKIEKYENYAETKEMLKVLKRKIKEGKISEEDRKRLKSALNSGEKGNIRFNLIDEESKELIKDVYKKVVEDSIADDVKDAFDEAKIEPRPRRPVDKTGRVASSYSSPGKTGVPTDTTTVSPKGNEQKDVPNNQEGGESESTVQSPNRGDRVYGYHPPKEDSLKEISKQLNNDAAPSENNYEKIQSNSSDNGKNRLLEDSYNRKAKRTAPDDLSHSNFSYNNEKSEDITVQEGISFEGTTDVQYEGEDSRSSDNGSSDGGTTDSNTSGPRKIQDIPLSDTSKAVKGEEIVGGERKYERNLKTEQKGKNVEDENIPSGEEKPDSRSSKKPDGKNGKLEVLKGKIISIIANGIFASNKKRGNNEVISGDILRLGNNSIKTAFKTKEKVTNKVLKNFNHLPPFMADLVTRISLGIKSEGNNELIESLSIKNRAERNEIIKLALQEDKISDLIVKISKISNLSLEETVRLCSVEKSKIVKKIKENATKRIKTAEVPGIWKIIAEEFKSSGENEYEAIRKDTFKTLISRLENKIKANNLLDEGQLEFNNPSIPSSIPH